MALTNIEGPTRGSSPLRWLPAVAVAIGAAVATAHGLFEVAVASRVPGPVAVTYPVITDGLALVAYSATSRLHGKAAAYAWTVVVTAAVVSGLAQAAYLAADSVVAAPALRFGVGAWPAVACALVAHLLHLILVAEREDEGPAERDTAGTERPVTDAPVAEPAAAQATPAVALPALPAGEPADEPAPAAVDVDDRVVALAHRLAHGEDLTGPAVALEHGVSDRTGRRLLGDARAHLENDPAASRPTALHLLTRQETGA